MMKEDKPKEVEWQLPSTEELDLLMLQVFGPEDRYKAAAATPTLLEAINNSPQVRTYLQQFVDYKSVELATNPVGAILAWMAYGFLLGHIWGHQHAPPAASAVAPKEPSRIILLH